MDKNEWLDDEIVIHEASPIEINVMASNRLVPQHDTLSDNSPKPEDQSLADVDFVPPRRKYEKKKRSITLHECEYCGKVLKYPSKIAEHMRSHSGDRPFTCGICRASFTQGHALKAHLRMHENINPYECRYCHRGFKTASNRNVHERTCREFTSHDVNTRKLRKHSRRQAREEEPTDHVYDNYDDTEYEEESMLSPQKIMVSTIEELIEHVNDPGQVQELPVEELEHTIFHDENEESVAYYVPIDHSKELDLDDPSSSQLPLKFMKRPDGSLVVGDQILHPEILPDGRIVYNYPDSDENLHFILDENNPLFEEYQQGEGDQSDEEIQVHPDEVVVYEESEALEEHLNDVHVLPDAEILVDDYIPLEHPPEQHFDEMHLDHSLPGPSFITDEAVLADPRPPRRGRPKFNIPEIQHEEDKLLEVPLEVFELAAPKLERRSKLGRYQASVDMRPAKNLNWVIDAVAKNMPLEEMSPHVRKRPQIYTCEVCGQVVKYPSKIEAHKRTHNGERPFACEICGLSFSQRTTLRMHLRRHLNHRPFGCTIDGCTRSFISGALLNEHIQKRHLGHKFACLRSCGRLFRTNRERQRHEQACSMNVHDNYTIEFIDAKELPQSHVINEVMSQSNANSLSYH